MKLALTFLTSAFIVASTSVAMRMLMQPRPTIMPPVSSLGQINGDRSLIKMGQFSHLRHLSL